MVSAKSAHFLFPWRGVYSVPCEISIVMAVDITDRDEFKDHVASEESDLADAEFDSSSEEPS